MARRVTKTQYTPGATVDGTRIERTLAEVAAAVSEVKPGDLRTSFMPFSLTGGWTPYNATDTNLDANGTRYARGTAGPWGRGFLTVDDYPITVPSRPRFKGLRVTTMPGNLVGDWWVWTVRLATLRPILLDAVSLYLLSDDPAGAQYLANTHKQVTVGPTGAPAVNDYTQDVHVLVDCMDPFDPADTDKTQVVFRKGDFPANAYFVTPSTPAAGWQDMLPAFPITSWPFGIAVDSVNLGLAIPGNSVVRIAFAIPAYVIAPAAAEYTAWGLNPTSKCAASWTVTGLEQV